MTTYYIVSESVDFKVRVHAKSANLRTARNHGKTLYENGVNGVLVVAATDRAHAVARAERLYSRQVPFSTALNVAA